VAQAADWWRIVTGPIEAPEVVEEDRAFLASAREILLGSPFDADIWRTLTNALKEQTGRKGKALFLPLRRALTGLDHGPDMGQLLPLIGKDEAVKRLS
jgi:glutamyl-tRNA synthetase